MRVNIEAIKGLAAYCKKYPTSYEFTSEMLHLIRSLASFKEDAELSDVGLRLLSDLEDGVAIVRLDRENGAVKSIHIQIGGQPWKCILKD